MLKGDEVLRNHVGWQAGAQMGAQGVVIRRARFGYQIGNKAHITGHIFAGDDETLCDIGMGRQCCFDLTGFNAKATQLDLGIVAAEVFEQSVGPPASPVTGAIESGTRGDGERIIDEAFGGQSGLIQVTERDAIAADPEFAGYPNRTRLAMLVKDVYDSIGNRLADADTGIGIGHAPAGRPDGSLGGTIHIPQLAGNGQQACRQIGAERFTTDQCLKAGWPLPASIEEHAPSTWGGLHHGSLRLPQQRCQCLRISGLLARGKDDFSTDAQRQQQLEYGNIKRQGCDSEQPVIGNQSGFLLHAGEKIDNSPMRYFDALGFAGRAGGIDHISDIIGRRIVRWVGQYGVNRLRIQQISIAVEQDGVRARPRQDSGIGEFGDEDSQPGVGGHIGQAFGRIRRVERYVGGTAFEDSQLGDEHVEAAFNAQADTLGAPDATYTQQMGELIGALFKYAIVHDGIVETYSITLWCGTRLTFDQCMDRRLARVRTACCVPQR